MAPLNPRMLLQSALASGGAGAPGPTSPIPGAASPAGGTAAGPQGGMQDALPGNLAGAQPVGAESSGVLSTTDLQNQMGVGGNEADATGQAVQQMIAAIQDPRTPPNQKAQIQAQLQLAALRALTRGPSGAVGSPEG